MKNILISSFIFIASFGIETAAQGFSFYDEVSDGDLSDVGSTPTSLGSLNLGKNTLKATFNRGSNPDPDYFTFNIPQGQVLTEIFLKSWNTSPFFEDIAFIAIEEGPSFDFVFSNTANSNPAEGLLGWSHLRSTQVGTNKILTEMALSNLDPITSGLNIVVNQEADNNPYTPEQIAQFPSGVTEDQLKQNLRNLGVIGTSGSTIGWFPGATGFKLPLGPGDYSIWLRQGTDTEISVELDFNTAKVPEPNNLFGIIITLGLGTLRFKKK
ncbi:PEP-CTERM sorting domain-containing protein [Crocosphaera sp. UHCC 0190]|uniref:PEP-CTERM sorting domain-containing protein n=1 Tax=Crocosphaera sp. UHCC 0190 TaxID=3110246 RepID=UPI002B2143E3|nr:PEP-CTERM sorting domain-containing protein [Crocosphaera sp. UHCC 0190]MEA5508159.1 PEP-CTERM sorting domain-containing protein [Crocosphaera sp. UHCC 0190]